MCEKTCRNCKHLRCYDWFYCRLKGEIGQIDKETCDLFKIDEEEDKKGE